MSMCHFQEYRTLFDDVSSTAGEKTLEDKFFEHEVCYLFTFLTLCYYQRVIFSCSIVSYISFVNIVCRH